MIRPSRVVGAGLAGWSIRHPIGVVMIGLAISLLGLFALDSLKIDLLPHIIYPEVRVRVVNPGVPASIMEDEVTRQLEEQLAITEDVIHVQSNTREGRSAVDLSFRYGKDIDVALRDASTRLDRAKRFLPDDIDPPVIYKRDPSQLPVAEYVVRSSLRDPIQLRSWVDYNLSNWLLNLPGVAATEVGGGLIREIQVVANQQQLTGLGLDIKDIAELLQDENQDISGGRLRMPSAEIASRTQGRFSSIEDLISLPVTINADDQSQLTLGEIAGIIDGHQDAVISVRSDGLPGVKVSIQKQPQANTVAVVQAVNQQLQELQDKGLIPEDIQVALVNDEARFIKRSLNNAMLAAISGAILAMIVVYLFLGSLRRTLIIGSAIPIAILVTMILMSVGGLTLNTMTLGGLALGIGMLVDSTIVMLENIYRHQRENKAGQTDNFTPERAAAEVNSAIVASTSTNLAAILPFLFISGLIGLLFRELIFTISAAILASLVVALTLIPALASRVPARKEGTFRRAINSLITRLQHRYAIFLGTLLRRHSITLVGFLVISVTLVLLTTNPFQAYKEFLPSMDDGRISIRLSADPGTNIHLMDQITRQIEALAEQQDEVDSVFTVVGGFIFGRSEFQSPNRSYLSLQLKPFSETGIKSQDWIKGFRAKIEKAQIVGVKIRISVRGIRGLRIHRGNDDISFRVKGPSLEALNQIGDQIVEVLEQTPGLRNIQHSNEDVKQELSIRIDRQRAEQYGLTTEDIGEIVQYALEGRKVTEFITDDRSVDVILKLSPEDFSNPQDLDNILIFTQTTPRASIRLTDVASIRLLPTASNIMRDHQQHIVEITASLTDEIGLTDVLENAQARLDKIDLANSYSGYSIYESGNLEAIKEGRSLGWSLLGLAVFLVFVVMAVQYESLRNPLIILLGLPFTVTGVALGLHLTDTSISMPVWLGLIMLAGIVVNNAIVLVEYIEIKRQQGMARLDAIIEGARLRIRPILMTTLTTVFGMLPLALALGEGGEMLQPLAITIISGLLYATLVSLLLTPTLYFYLGRD